MARAGSGDPRLVNGVLEWPAAVTNEQFVIVRGDDGVLYYVGIAAARREGGATAGNRISVIGLEGRSPHEVTAVGIGTGSTAEAALAQLQGLRQPAPVAPVSPAPAAAPPVTAAPPVAGVAPANANATPAAPKATAPSAPAVRQPDPPSPKSPAIDTRAPASTAAPAVVPASTPTTAPSPSGSTTPMLVPTDEHRWVEITGEVESLSGRTLVLKVDGGRVSVDLSSLRANLERVVTPGSMVKVYGVPVELRFKAMGFIDPDARARAPRPN